MFKKSKNALKILGCAIVTLALSIVSIASAVGPEDEGAAATTGTDTYAPMSLKEILIATAKACPTTTFMTEVFMDYAKIHHISHEGKDYYVVFSQSEFPKGEVFIKYPGEYWFRLLENEEVCYSLSTNRVNGMPYQFDRTVFSK